MKKLYLIALCSLILFSCERIYIIADARIKGVVFDSTTFDRIPNAIVTVYKNVDCNLGSTDLCDRWESVKSENTDNKGEYFIKFNDNNREYRISAAKEGYYKSGYWYKVSKDIEYVDLFLFPQTTLTMQIENTPPQNDDDVLEVELHNNGNREAEILTYNFHGAEVDTILNMTVYGNFTHNIFWKVHKTDTILEYDENIHCLCDEENRLIIQY